MKKLLLLVCALAQCSPAWTPPQNPRKSETVNITETWDLQGDQAQVMVGSKHSHVWKLVVEHALDPVVSVRHLHIDPRKVLSIPAAAPDVLTSQDVLIESQRRIEPARVTTYAQIA